MPLIFFQNNPTPPCTGQRQLAFHQSDLAQLLMAGLAESLPRCAHNARLQVAAPQDWQMAWQRLHYPLRRFDQKIRLDDVRPLRVGRHAWKAVFSGRYAVQYNDDLLSRLLLEQDADIILLTADPQLQSYRETPKVSSENQIAGFRRLYADLVHQDICPPDWPHAIFIRDDGKNLTKTQELPLSFPDFLAECQANHSQVISFRIAGQVLDLESESGLLRLAFQQLTQKKADRQFAFEGRFIDRTNSFSQNNMPVTAQTFAGTLLLGRDVEIAEDAILLGPLILGDHVCIGAGTTIDSSIVGPNHRIEAGHTIRKRVLLNGTSNDTPIHEDHKPYPPSSSWKTTQSDTLSERYKLWPKWSYPTLGKRIADIIVSAGALLFFAPIFPFLALAVKLNSPGPVFYRAKRQGRYGRDFYCLKFRSMMTGADRLQQLLRKRNQVDGPQFKMEDDPRVTRVGAFLRDTYLDEIPQFFNVLLGQMSIVGPRPSPEEENMLCPWWRDARLSVRPGITGHWQVSRTRTTGQDFQEWIYYDTEYVHNLGARMDLWICWKTTRQFLWRFLRKF